MDLKTLLTAVTVKKEGDVNLKVKIIPRADVELPIEIVSLVPDVVRLAGDVSASTMQYNAEEQKTENAELKAARQAIAEQLKDMEEKGEEAVHNGKTGLVKSIKRTKTKVVH